MQEIFVNAICINRPPVYFERKSWHQRNEHFLILFIASQKQRQNLHFFKTHDHSLSLLDIGSSKNRGGIKLFSPNSSFSEMMQLFSGYPYFNGFHQRNRSMLFHQRNRSMLFLKSTCLYSQFRVIIIGLNHRGTSDIGFYCIFLYWCDELLLLCFVSRLFQFRSLIRFRFQIRHKISRT